MTYRMTIIHPVADFERWRAKFGDKPHYPGLVGRYVYRAVDDSNEVMVELDFESAEAAEGFLPSLANTGILDSTGLDVYPPVFVGAEVPELRYADDDDVLSSE